MSITIHLASIRASDDASADIGSPSRCGALNMNGTNAAAVLRIAMGGDALPRPYGELPAFLIANAIGRIGAALDCTAEADAARTPMVSPANEQPHRNGARVIMQPQTDERARERLAALLVLLSIALSRGEGIAWQ